MDEILSYIICTLLICCSGLFSGLNLGLLALDLKSLEIIMEAGSEKEKKYASKVYKVRKHGNFLLCTLLLGNVIVNAGLAIFLADIAGGLVGFIISSVAIVFFGEIIPQAIVVRNGLLVGAYTCWLVRTFMVLLAIFAWPISKALDYFLGDEIPQAYSKNELSKFIEQQQAMGKITKEEQQVIKGALEFNEKEIRDIMTPFEKVFSLHINEVLCADTMKTILNTGHSRIPVWDDAETNVVGILFVKDLVLVDPNAGIPLRTILGFHEREVLRIFPDIKLQELMNEMKNSQNHMAIVHDVLVEEGKDPYYKCIGIVTLEDAIEEILQDEIVDETDVYLDSSGKHVVAKKDKVIDYKELERKLDDFKRTKKRKKFNLTEHQIKAIVSYFRMYVDALGERYLSAEILENLVHEANVVRIAPEGEEFEDHIEGEENLSVEPSTGVMISKNPILFKRGVETTRLVLVLQGKIEIRSGAEEFISEAGPFTVLGLDALTHPKFLPDFSAKAIEFSEIIIISRASYLNAIKASSDERLVEPGTEIELKEVVVQPIDDEEKHDEKKKLI